MCRNSNLTLRASRLPRLSCLSVCGLNQHRRQDAGLCRAPHRDRAGESGPVPRLLRLLLPARRGGMSRLFHAVYARIRASWQMLPLGFLFDLGFDTATEVAVLGLSSAFAQHSHFPVWGVLVFPLLFAAGMSLMDTLDGLAMRSSWRLFSACDSAARRTPRSPTAVPPRPVRAWRSQATPQWPTRRRRRPHARRTIATTPPHR